MLHELGWNTSREAEWELASEPGFAPGRVVRVDRDRTSIATDKGIVELKSQGLAVGDWVATDSVSRTYPLARTSSLTRLRAGRTSDEQVLATNVDYTLIVEPLAPAPNLRRIERMLALAWASGSQPVVVLTKADLGARGAASDVIAVAPGVRVLSTSARTGEGLTDLRGLLRPGLTFVLIGPSGAGKSSLVNELAQTPVIRVGEVRGDGRGRHTTSHRQLVLIKGLGTLIDTPGLRSVGMIGDASGLDDAFSDVMEYAERCRFADCSHTGEPGCGVNSAVADGELSAGRVSNFQRLEREARQQARRRQVKDRREERTEGKGRVTAKRMVMDAKGRRKGM